MISNKACGKTESGHIWERYNLEVENTPESGKHDLCAISYCRACQTITVRTKSGFVFHLIDPTFIVDCD
jgi:hypothetical protein